MWSESSFVRQAILHLHQQGLINMYYENVKKRIIKGLMDEIQAIGAGELELIGHRVIEILVGCKMIHHGLNKDYRPAGYTVDSFDQIGSIVGAYSVESGYFNDSSAKDAPPEFKKIEKDFNGALEHCSGDIKKLYLISSQEEPPSFRAKFNNSAIFKKNRVEEIIIYDARELAKHIYEHSQENQTAAAFYCDFFPDFAHNLNNYEYYGKVPSICHNHFSEPAFIESIANHYKNDHKICVLSGLSGTGKTQASIDFLRTHTQKFNNYIWISGEDWREGTPLTSIQRARGGFPINVSGLFNSTKTLLVIDNLERVISEIELKELSNGFKLGGFVLITSQFIKHSDPIYLPIPELSTEVAFKIIGQNQNSATGNCKNFIAKCKFSPLILATARDIAREEDINAEDLYAEILAKPSETVSKDGTSIMRKILSHLNDEYRQTLVKIADSGVFIHDSRFLDFYVGYSCRIALQRIGILKHSSVPGMLTVHDLICKAMQENPNTESIANAIEEYIEKFSGDMRPSVIREIHVCAQQLRAANISKGKRTPDWITYALLQIDGISNLDIVESLYSQPISAVKSLKELLCIIDAKEIYAYRIEDRDEKQTFFNNCAHEYAAATSDALPHEIKIELLHHAGKAFRRCDMYTESFDSFNELLKLEPKWHATLSQIAHLGTQYKASNEIKLASQESLKELLGYIFDEYKDVPLRVSLAAISLLRSYKELVSDIIKSREKVETIATIISMSALEGLHQFYEALFSFTSMFSYQHGDICLSLARDFPEMFEAPPSLIEQRQWTSVCEVLTNIAIVATEESLKGRSAAAACRFADAILETQKPSPFTVRAVAKAYITGGFPEKAISCISLISSEKLDHWVLYRKAEAELLLDKPEDALRSAQHAFDLALKDCKASDRISIYYEQVAKCHLASGNTDLAIKNYKEAVHKCSNDKYRNELEKRLNALTETGKP